MNIVNNRDDRNNFDSIAPYYNRLQKLVFGQQLLVAQIHFFQKISSQSKVLVVGGGSGEFLPHLLARNPKQITYVESSLAMMNIAKNNFSDVCIDWQHKNVLDWKSEIEYDFILLPFVLDVFLQNKVDEIVKHISTSLTVNSKVILTDFYYTGKFYHKMLISIMILFFSLFSGIKARRLPNYEKSFARLNLVKTDSVNYLDGMVKSVVFS
ncbi:MAG: class I SAM-dependent methyltransferase [Salibacteraceae bacterium]